MRKIKTPDRNRKYMLAIGMYSLAICFTLLIGSLFGKVIKPSSDYRADDDLMASFVSRKPLLYKLVSMMDEDKNIVNVSSERFWTTFNSEWPRPQSEWGISPKRWNSYQNLLQKLDLPHDVVRHENGDIVILISGSGILVGAGEDLGYT